jgi:hypothetical protein
MRDIFMVASQDEIPLPAAKKAILRAERVEDTP